MQSSATSKTNYRTPLSQVWTYKCCKLSMITLVVTHHLYWSNHKHSLISKNINLGSMPFLKGR